MQGSADLEAYVRRIYDLMGSTDADAVAGLVADHDGVVVVGTDEEWWAGPEVARTAMREQQASMGPFAVTAGDVHAYESGDVGWFDDQPSIAVQGEAAVPLRLTGVAHRDADGWHLVQLHLSVPASLNEALAPSWEAP